MASNECIAFEAFQDEFVCGEDDAVDGECPEEGDGQATIERPPTVCSNYIPSCLPSAGAGPMEGGCLHMALHHVKWVHPSPTDGTTHSSRNGARRVATDAGVQ
mmetsp:Transcript_47418/g.88050  ORF Transcript_47418/g.88050 Transcript_47418/m.88050 type:complete len:103 (+) Transcript_47418:89-397(+)